PAALWFLEEPSNISTSPGRGVRLSCRVGGAGPPPELGWLLEGAPLELADTDLAQLPLGDHGWVATSQLRLPSVQVADAGRYRCWAQAGGHRL
ncbi:UFO kinase, partial [Rhinopomastus cyanomelas]|nr:UFO kinase [Rhinopomastus cyanomelas]